MTNQINSTLEKLSSQVIKPVLQQARSRVNPICINRKIEQIKQLFPALLLPLILLQSPVLAQTKSPSEGTKPVPATVVVPPTLVPLKGTEQVQLQLVNCGWWIDCALARLLLPASAHIDQRELQFDNSTQVPVNILSTATIVAGDLTGYQLNRQAISLPQDLKSLPANQIVSIPITLNRAEMPPDRYSGAIYLTLKERSDRLSLSVNLSVRSGPLLPLIVLLFGVILGRLFKYMEERGEPQAKILEEVYRLQAYIAGAKLEERDKQLLAEMAKEVQTLVYREKLDILPDLLQTIRDRLTTLVKLQSLEDQLNEQATTFSTDVDTFTVKISKARFYIAQEEDAKAKELLEEIKADLDNVGTRGTGETAGIEALKRSLTEATTATVSIGKTPLTIPKPLGNFKQFMVTLSGVSDRVRAETTFWIVRPLLSLILLVGLSAVGMGSLYVDNGTTFGARPFSDYLGLILWGLSADVASRSLSSLKGGNE
jgi:BMFP domain-containing protein YqiC